MGQRKKTALGAFTSSVNFLTMEIDTVDTPAASTALCISPTDRLHIPHPGVSSATSTPSLFRRRATSGAVSSMSVLTWRPSMWPMKP